MIEAHRIAVIIPALNEQEALGEVLEAIPAWVDRILVADNGSTDATAQVARDRGAEVVTEPRRGYGAACLAALRHLAASGDGGPDIIVFLDGDRSDYPEQMGRLTGPIIAGEADLVIGSRILGGAPPRSLTLPQRLGNRLAAMLIRRLWGLPCTDLGPFRAIHARALARCALRLRAAGRSAARSGGKRRSRRLSRHAKRHAGDSRCWPSSRGSDRNCRSH